MRRIIFQSFYLILITAMLSSASFVQAQVRPYRVSERQVQTLLTRIELNTDTYRRSMDLALDRGRLNGSDSEEMVMGYITEFENATDRLKQKFDARSSISSDVQEVLDRAALINAFMQRNALNAASQRNWTNIRSDLNTLATYYNVSWNWTNPVNTTPSIRPNRASNRDILTLLTRIEIRTDDFKRVAERSVNRGVINNTSRDDSITSLITDFESATDRLKQRFDARQAESTDVEDVLMRANSIESFLTNNRLGNNVQRQWDMVKTDLNTLANYYNVAWDWNRRYNPSNPSNPSYPTNSSRGLDAELTGTYRLNLRQSDNVREVVDRELRSSTATQSDRLRTSLERRLQSPEMIVIEKRSNQVSMASSNAPQITFSADGAARTEQTPNGRSISVKATTDYDSLNISYEGDRMRDFQVDFMPINNGRQLRVTRRIYLENRSEMIAVNSVYDKTSEIAQWSNVNTVDTNVGNVGNVNVGDFYIPNGTRVTAVLNNMISTKDSQDSDRFTMTVNSPSQYEGAVITGRILKSESSGRVTGRANISLDFDTIRLRNGQTYRFAGIIDGVTSASGENVSVNNEGAVRDSNQTTKTVTRAGIGAALGALIGAIAGGGEGAAIGAAVGAGAGAGTIFIQGRDNLELGQGTEFRITASAPNNLNR